MSVNPPRTAPGAAACNARDAPTDGALDVAVARGIDEAGRAVNFDAVDDPVILADLQTINGSDAATMRLRSLDAGVAELFIEDEHSRDDEIGPWGEDVAIATLSAGVYDLLQA